DESLDRLVQVRAAHRAKERGITEGEDATVGADHEVPLARRRRDGAEDRAIQRLGRQVAEALGGALRENPALAGEDPVALARRGGREARNLLAALEGRRVDPAEAGVGVAEGVHAAPVVV